jgi:hypothetical protein
VEKGDIPISRGVKNRNVPFSHYPTQVRNAPVSMCTKSERW